MMSSHYQEFYVTIGRGVMVMCFVQLNDVKIRLFMKKNRHGRKIIYQHIAEGTRESHPSVHDLQHP